MQRSRIVLITLAALVCPLVGCGGDESSGGFPTSVAATAPAPETPSFESSTSVAVADPTTAPRPTTAASVPTTAPATTTTAPASTTATADTAATTHPAGDWEEALGSWCSTVLNGLETIVWPTSPDRVEPFVDRWREVANAAPVATSLPEEFVGELGDLDSTLDAHARLLDEALAAADRNDAEGVELAVEQADDLITQTMAMTVVAGVACGPVEPTMMSAATLNVPVLGAWQIENGFGSIWVSQQFLQRVDGVGAAAWLVGPAMTVSVADSATTRALGDTTFLRPAPPGWREQDGR